MRPIVFLTCLALFSLTACRADTSIGTDCNTGNDCESNACATGWPNGYCTQECTSDSACGTRGKCIVWGDANICLAQCVRESDCRTGSGCAPLDSGGHVCAPWN